VAPAPVVRKIVHLRWKQRLILGRTLCAWRVDARVPCGVRTGRHVTSVHSDVLAWMEARRESRPGERASGRRSEMGRPRTAIGTIGEFTYITAPNPRGRSSLLGSRGTPCCGPGSCVSRHPCPDPGNGQAERSGWRRALDPDVPCEWAEHVELHRPPLVLDNPRPGRKWASRPSALQRSVSSRWRRRRSCSDRCSSPARLATATHARTTSSAPRLLGGR